MTARPFHLLGPADADHYRVEHGRYKDRWYTDPLPGDADWAAVPDDWDVPAVSIVKKASGADWSTVALGRAADDLHTRPAVYQGATRGQILEAFKSADKLGLAAAGGRGTIVHAWAEDLLAGRAPRVFSVLDLAAMDLPAAALADARRYLPALEQFFADHGPELVATEAVAIHRDLNGAGYGGTLDAVVRIAGELYVIDWKTRSDASASSKHAAYPEDGGQVSAYGRAQYWIVADADGAPVRVPPLELAGGLVISLRPDSYRAYPVDLDAGFQHWTAMHAWWLARRSERKPIGRGWAPKAGSKPAAVAVDPGVVAVTSAAVDPAREPFDAGFELVAIGELGRPGDDVDPFADLAPEAPTHVAIRANAVDRLAGLEVAEPPPIDVEPPIAIPSASSATFTHDPEGVDAAIAILEDAFGPDNLTVIDAADAEDLRTAALSPPADFVADGIRHERRDNLRDRLERLKAAGHGDLIIRWWPADVPGFKGGHDHTDAELDAIRDMLRLPMFAIAADESSLPWDSELDGDRPTPPAPEETELDLDGPRPAELDDGPLVDPDARAELNMRYSALPADRRQMVDDIRRLMPAPHVTPDGRPHVRQWTILHALVTFAERVWPAAVGDLDELVAAATDGRITDARDGTLAELTIDEAERLADMAAQL